jgi:CO/xanthine dehydrogenase Mo-binding subunit
MGSAVRIAAREVRQQVLDMAARQLEANPDDLVLENRQIYVKGSPDKAVPIQRIAAMAAFATGPIQGKGAVNIAGLPCDPTYVKEGTVGGTQAHTYAVQCAEVEVDPETGQVHVSRLVAANDVGKAINPVGVEGQIVGGAAMGIGYALFEEMHYDANGRLLNPNLLDYKMVTSMDTPQLEAEIVEVWDPYGGPHGAKGVGEPPILPTAAAIANAIYDATGVLITELPITPERVRQALATRNR